MAERRRRLIEIAFPLEDVSRFSRNDPYLGPPHPQTLHRWWARRPLPACRAFIYASLVDDPGNDREREELLKEIADLSSWDAVRKPDHVVRSADKGGSGLTGRRLLERARQRILDSNGGIPPRLWDPFAGGGAIPLEALRLGCEVEASDLNPVASLILKCTLEYPQRYGQPNSKDVPGYISQAASEGHQGNLFEGDMVAKYRANPLATDILFWGTRMLSKAWSELQSFYPVEPDGNVPTAYLWSRTVKCPSCGMEMPLLSQYWLAKTGQSRAVLVPRVDQENGIVSFDVISGSVDALSPPTSGGDAVCLSCNQVIKAGDIRKIGLHSGFGAVMTSVVMDSQRNRGKSFRPSREGDLEVFRAAAKRLAEIKEEGESDIPVIPDEPIDPKTLGLRVDAFGFDTWSKLFNSRQLLTMAVLTKSVQTALEEMLLSGLDSDYAEAVGTYLALAVDRVAGENSTLTRWNANGPKPQGAMALQALSFISDYAEVNPWGGSVGDASSALSMVIRVVEDVALVDNPRIHVHNRDARDVSSHFDLVITDPPYYSSVDYAGLSDYFYVWLKRSLSGWQKELLGLPLTPKKNQAIMASETDSAVERSRYVDLMTQAFTRVRQSLPADGFLGIVFAHTDPEAWSTLIEGLLDAGLIPDASWPIDTEIGTKVSAVTQARLKTSVWMACLPRQEQVREAFLGDVLLEMQPAIRERLLFFWTKGIRGADFFISAIGPALSVFGQHKRVLRPDGSEVTVRDFLDLVRRESTTVALEQVLGGADLGVVDPTTRQYVTWVWSYSRAPLDTGEAIALCLATGADYHQVTRPHTIAAESKEKSKKVVKLRTIRERGQQDDDLGVESAARPTPLIDQLQLAAYLWSQNKQDDIAKYRSALGETRWQALRTLGQAVAECLPDGDEDRRLINGLMSSNVMSSAPRASQPMDQQTRLEI